MKHYEKELPENYVEAMVVDAKNKKVSVLMTLGSLLLTVLVFFVGLMVIVAVNSDYQAPVDDDLTSFVVKMLVFVATMIAYIVLHELTHGVVYKLLTKQKLTFGLTLTVAYCGVPNIFVYRTAAICALLAPFVVFDVVFLALTFVLQGGWQLIFLAMFAFHFGGCIGDLYDTALYTFKFRDKTTLMRDTGPKQTFYVLKSSPLGKKIVAAQSCQSDLKANVK